MTVRLWVTGLGLVTPLGVGVEATWVRLVRGDRAIAPLRLFDVTGQRASMTAEVEGVSVPSDPTGAWSRTSAMARVAVQEALRSAALEPASARVGLVFGSTTAGMFETERLLARLHAEPERRGALEDMRSHPLTATGERLEECLGPFARVRAVSSACSGGANAIVVAASWLLSGELDVVVAGGADALCRLTLSGFNALAALDPEPCRPFDRRRRGTNLGEGAGFLVLERAQHAEGRGAAPVAELAGWAVGAEAHHITNPAPDGAVVGRLMQRAIERAGLRPSDIDYVNAHGTGTPANDSMEGEALARALGEEALRVPVSSSKGQIGHTLGAAGGIEAAVTALVVARRTLVPTAGLDEPDPSIRLVHVPHAGREVSRVRAAMSNAFGFGGMSTVLVFTPPRSADDVRTARVRGNVSPPREHPCAPVITGVAVFGPCGRLGAQGCADLPTAATARAGSIIDAEPYLELGRARRLDRMARLATVAVEHALRDAVASGDSAGVVLGTAFGNVDACAAFLHKLFERGPRVASPAEFPNLVPSSPVGHVSIYAGMQGPTFATADLGTSGESAFAQAAQLVSAGEATCLVAGASEPRSDVVERVLSPLFDEAWAPERAARSDLAAAVVLESATEARERGARVLARVEQVVEWRGDGAGAIGGLRGPRTQRAEVVLTREDVSANALLARTPWVERPRLICAPALGESDALGAAAIAIAAARVGTGQSSEVLVVGLAPGRGYAVVLVAP